MKTLNTVKYVLLLVSLFLSQLLYAEYFRHIGVTKGLPQFSVMSIYQDELGRMWFGTKEGACVYDGNSVKTYRAYANNHFNEEEKILIGNDVQMIQGNKEGNIFIIADFTLLKYDIRRETFQKVACNTVHSLAAYDGDIWCMLNDSLYMYDENKDDLEFILKMGIDRSYCLTVTENQYYIGAKDGVYTVDRKSHEIDKIISGVEIYRIFESSQKEIWVGCRMDGLYRIDKEMNISKVPYSPGTDYGIGSHQIREFIEDDFNNIWFGTFDGLYKYDSNTKKYSSIKLRKSMGGLQHPSVFSLYRDKQGTIWIGSYYGGVNYFNPENDIFTRYNYEQYAEQDLYFSFIGGMAEDNEHNIWIGTDGGGLSCMNRNTGVFTNFKANKKNSLPHNNLKSIAYDSKRNYLYIGTYLGGVSRYDIKNKRFYNYFYEQTHKNSPNNTIFDVLFYQDRLYITSRNGFFSMHPDTNEFDLIYSHLYCKSFDISDGYAWLGLGKQLACIDLNTKQQIHNISLSNNGADFEITKVKTTKSGVYVATLGSGLFYYDKTTKEITRYTEEEGHLLSNYCYNLTETNQGNILITSDKGIVLFSPVNHVFRSISLLSGFPAPAIMNGCGVLVASDNEILIGDIEGITSFKENDLEISDVNLYFSKLSVNNQDIYPGDNTRILSEALPFTQELKLNYNQNNLIISFAVSNYVDLLQNNWYEYKLEGFDNEWISTQQLDLHYTNLNPGKYTIRVRSKGNSFETNQREISQSIIILHPWYNTVWAWILYLLIISLVVISSLRSKNIKRKLTLSLEKERFEKQQIEQMNRAKLLFFTNVSHEFRTPLTLIISHIELLLQSVSISPTLYEHIMKINKHALRMRNLVSELLDFRKFDQNHIELKVVEWNLVEFLREIYLSFLDYAYQRNIVYLFDTNIPKADVWFDPTQMEKVFFNLFSNAFKYTPTGGQICVKLVVEESVTIEITDNGTGIEAAQTKYIFERFYQAGNEQECSDMSPGTGIGLALTKSVVEKHHGSISVESELGKGSTFTIQLLRGKKHFLSDNNVIFPDKAEVMNYITNSMPTQVEFKEIALSIEENEFLSEEESPLSTTMQYTILVVEDNEDLLRVLQQLFAPFYKVVLARNGKQGLSAIAEEKPDLIISDIMMPEMTGTEMCLQIKNNIDYCHIPIILLTALNTTEQNIEGLNRGADDYITKPFNTKILLAKCNNLIRNRLLIQQQFTKKPISEIDLTAINPLDKDLLKQTIRIIEENIDNPEFDIPQLCKKLGMGRTLLYSKFKALTGMTPNNFILNYKLKKAAILLQTNPEMQVAEIADKLGFSSSIYFSRCFKSQFNISPQNYRKNIK